MSGKNFLYDDILYNYVWYLIVLGRKEFRNLIDIITTLVLCVKYLNTITIQAT